MKRNFLALSLSPAERAQAMRDSLYRFGFDPLAHEESASGSQGTLAKAARSPVARALVVGGALASVGAGLAVAQDYDGHLSGVANNTGAAGSDWHSDLFLHYNANQGDVPIVVQLAYARAGESPGDSFVPVTVQPGETLALRDVLGTTFGGEEGPGVIHYRVAQGDVDSLTINANTFNRVNARERYGQQVFGRRWSQAAGTGVRMFVPTPVDFESYRANLAVIAGPGTTQYRIVGQNKSGNLLFNQVFDAEPLSWNQHLRVVQRFLPGISLAGAYFTVVGVDGPVDAAMSFVNNATSDGNNIVGRTVFDTENNLWFTGAAYVKGAQGSDWRSDLQLVNANDGGQALSVVYLPRGQDNGGGLMAQGVALGALEGYAVQNVLRNLMGLENGSAGTLLVNTLADTPGIAFMQTPNVVGVDDEGRIISYGQNIPGINWGDAGRADLEVVVAGIDHNDDSRANLLLQNTLYDEPTGHFLPMQVEAELYTASGVLAHVESISLLPGEYKQIDKFVDSWLGQGANIEGGSVVLRTRELPANTYGGLNAMASVVNGNRNPGIGTNDGRLIVGQNVYKTNNAPYTDDCIENLASGTRHCDGDGDTVIDNVINITARGPPPGGPYNFRLDTFDDDQDHTTLSLEGYPSIPSYVSLEGNTLIIDPSPEHVGEQFELVLRPYDHHHKEGLQKTMMFRVSS